MIKENSILGRANINFALIWWLSVILISILLSLLISAVASASIANVTVNVPIGNQPEYLVRQIARIEAQQKGINRLPVVIRGTERLDEQGYKFDIKAIMVGNVDVEIVEEKWDRKNNQYSLNANVRLNDEATKELLEQVLANENAQSALNDAYSMIENMIEDGINQENYIEVKQQLSLIKSRAILKGTLAASLQAREEFIKEVKEFGRNAYLQPLVDDGFKIEVIDVNHWKVLFRFSVKQAPFQKLNEYSSSNELIKATKALRYEGVCFSANSRNKPTVLAHFDLDNIFGIGLGKRNARRDGDYYYFDVEYEHRNNEALFQEVTNSVKFDLCHNFRA